MNSDRFTSTLVHPPTKDSSSSLTHSDALDKGTRTIAWPVVALLAVIPTANIQISSPFFSLNETCVRTYRRDETPGCYEVYFSWYAPKWEDIAVPEIKTVSHIKASLRFQGALKWLPYSFEI